MFSKSYSLLAVLIISAAVLTWNGCQRDADILEPAAYPTDAEVFTDGFGPGVEYQAFGDAKLDALQIDSEVKYAGNYGLKISVPSEGYAFGTYAGGTFVSGSGRDLRGYNAVTFWAKASIPAQINVAGIGNDNTANAKFTAQRTNLPINTTWQKYIIPIPASGKLTKEKGLFFFAIANVSGTGFEVWMDEIKYENLGTLAHPRLSILSRSVDLIAGDTVKVNDPVVTFDNIGTAVTVQASASYLTLISSDSNVAIGDNFGTVRAVGAGTAVITAKLGSATATGTITVKSTAAAGPATAAPTPTIAADKVLSIFSDSYTNLPVDTWAATWGTGRVTDTSITGNNVKIYSNLGFAAIDFSNHQIDASTMTHIYMNMWTIYPTTSPAAFKIKLVDFGPDGIQGTMDDIEQEVSLTATTTPAIATGSWVTLDISLSEFALTSQGNLAQIIISGDLKTVWLDNIFFYKGTGGPVTVPTTPPPAPTASAANVVSLLSNYYTNVPVETWAASWLYSTAVVRDRVVGGELLKLYTDLNFAGILLASPIDVSTMTRFHMDIWTPNPTALPKSFKILLIDFGANGVSGGGDDSQHELSFTAATTPGLVTGSWVSIDVPLSNFTGLTGKSNLAQMVISGDLKTVWVGNVYFYKGGGTTPGGPTTPAPTPTLPASNVISLFSDAYTNVPVDTWSASWDQADLTDTTIAGNNVKLYRNLVYAGVECLTNTINATSMTHFHMDIWTPNATSGGVVFKIKLVDFGANGSFGGGDDVEHELTFSATTSPALTTGSWVSFDIPLSSFTSLTTKAHMAQFIISGGLNTVWVDNIYFHN
ncbi:MAG: hypothetical protein HUU54_15760 [Ignavibacteriaceae bacterium]|nr:hypothetical protein [Ignavibacteriaceae bacterium]